VAASRSSGVVYASQMAAAAARDERGRRFIPARGALIHPGPRPGVARPLPPIGGNLNFDASRTTFGLGGGQEEASMSNKLMSAAVVAAALVVFGGVPAMAKCFVDEGNGRRTPCEAMLKHQKKPAKAVRSTATQAGPVQSAPGQSAPVGASGRSDRSGGRAASF
jgi:hypothetical protein